MRAYGSVVPALGTPAVARAVRAASTRGPNGRAPRAGASRLVAGSLTAALAAFEQKAVRRMEAQDGPLGAGEVDRLDAFDVPGIESQKAQDLIAERFPDQGGDSATLVLGAGDDLRPGRVPARSVARSRRSASNPMSVRSTIRSPGAGCARRSDGLRHRDLRPDGGRAGGGTARAALSSLLTTLVGPAVVFGLMGLAAGGVEIPSLAPTMAAMLGLGAGIDYALLGAARRQEELRRGRSPAEAAAIANATAGHSAVTAAAIVLLTATFRSLKIAVLSAVLNLVAIAAAYGAIHLLFHTSVGTDLIGVEVQPIVPYVPLSMFAILFGLSTDYNVFLLSRVREEWLSRASRVRARPGDASTADARGHVPAAVAEATVRTRRVIAAAGAIMIAVFLGFATDADTTMKMSGFGLASAILVDTGPGRDRAREDRGVDVEGGARLDA